MKLKKDKQIDYQSNTVFEGQDATISTDDMDKLFDLLQDPYKNPIGAVVREYTSNAFDSHAEAAFIKANSISDIRTEFPDYLNSNDDEINELKKHLEIFDDDAVLVTMGKDETGHFWAVEDFGIGLSHDRVVNIFGNYLKSTKEHSNSNIGAFGIGSKSGLSYTDVVHIRARYNGIERTYMLRKGEKSPRLDFVSDNGTTERNGTQIKIYIKETKQYSYSQFRPENYRFEEECKKQLAYFDNVYFTGQNGYSLPKDYHILQGKTWIKNTEITPFRELHLCLGKVAYPIDWDNLGIEPIHVDLALKFEIGELDIIQTREDLKYTPRTKQVLLDKIQEFKIEIENKWDETYNGGVIENFSKYLTVGSNYNYINYSADNQTVSIDIRDIFNEKEMKAFKIEYKPFKDVGLTHNIFKDSFFIDYKIPSYINATGLKHRNERVFHTLTNYPVYRIQGNHESKKSKYIFSELESEPFYLLRKSKPSLKEYVKQFDLTKYPKSKWRTIIKTIQKAVSSFIFEYSYSYKKVEIDQEWLKSTYKKRSTIDRSLFNIYQLKMDSTYTEKVRKNKVASTFGKRLCVIGTKESKDILWEVKGIFDNILNIRARAFFLYAGKTNLKYFDELTNVINIDNIMEHKLFIKYCTARYLRENNNILKRFLELGGADMFKNINTEIYNNLNKLSSYISKYCSYIDSPILRSMYKTMVKEDRLDKNIIDLFNNTNQYFEPLTILNYVNIANLPEEELAKLIYRFNKSLPISQHRKMNPNFYVNLNKEELEWLKGSKDEAMYKKPRMLK